MNVTDSRLCLTATSKLRYGERIGTGVGSLLPCLAQLSRSVSCLRVCLRNSAERAGGSNVDSRAAVPSTPFLLPRRGVATENWSCTESDNRASATDVAVSGHPAICKASTGRSRPGSMRTRLGRSTTRFRTLGAYRFRPMVAELDLGQHLGPL
jgi:hypothetical protein